MSNFFLNIFEKLFLNKCSLATKFYTHFCEYKIFRRYYLNERQSAKSVHILMVELKVLKCKNMKFKMKKKRVKPKLNPFSFVIRYFNARFFFLFRFEFQHFYFLFFVSVRPSTHQLFVCKRLCVAIAFTLSNPNRLFLDSLTLCDCQILVNLSCLCYEIVLFSLPLLSNSSRTNENYFCVSILSATSLVSNRKQKSSSLI